MAARVADEVMSAVANGPQKLSAIKVLMFRALQTESKEYRSEAVALAGDPTFLAAQGLTITDDVVSM